MFSVDDEKQWSTERSCGGSILHADGVGAQTQKAVSAIRRRHRVRRRHDDETA